MLLTLRPGRLVGLLLRLRSRTRGFHRMSRPWSLHSPGVLARHGLSVVLHRLRLSERLRHLVANSLRDSLGTNRWLILWLWCLVGISPINTRRVSPVVAGRKRAITLWGAASSRLRRLLNLWHHRLVYHSSTHISIGTGRLI